MKRFLAMVIGVAMLGMPLWANTYYVATTGSDVTGDGTSGNPWATIQHAIDSITGAGHVLGEALFQ